MNNSSEIFSTLFVYSRLTQHKRNSPIFQLELQCLSTMLVKVIFPPCELRYSPPYSYRIRVYHSYPEPLFNRLLSKRRGGTHVDAELKIVIVAPATAVFISAWTCMILKNTFAAFHYSTSRPNLDNGPLIVPQAYVSLPHFDSRHVGAQNGFRNVINENYVSFRQYVGVSEWYMRATTPTCRDSPGTTTVSGVRYRRSRVADADL